MAEKRRVRIGRLTSVGRVAIELGRSGVGTNSGSGWQGVSFCRTRGAD